MWTSKELKARGFAAEIGYSKPFFFNYYNHFKSEEAHVEINELSKYLLAEGYSKTDTPPGCRVWNDFYGGWCYTHAAVREMTFETPCGLLVSGHSVGSVGYLSYNGIHWMFENDCYTIPCPYSLEECKQRHPLLHTERSKLGSGGIALQCNIHQTGKPYDYEHSAEKAERDLDEEKERLFAEFSEKRNGRVCVHHCHFDRTHKVWSFRYDPLSRCTAIPCTFCSVLKKEISSKKANIYYDIKRTMTVPRDGFFPDQEKVEIVKGVKFLDRQISETICEAILKANRSDIIHMKTRPERGVKVELINLRVERRATRDLRQDLADVRDGIEVIHASDQQKAAAAKKREQRKERRLSKRRKIRIERILLSCDNPELTAADPGLVSDEDFKRFRRLIERIFAEFGCDNPEQKYLEIAEQRKPKGEPGEQFDLFGDDTA